MSAEEKLMAFVDEALPAEERASVEAALAGDDRLRQALVREVLLRTKLATLHRSALTEATPERLMRLLTVPQRTSSLPA
jgi:anti-sigma factor RsiW